VRGAAVERAGDFADPCPCDNLVRLRPLVALALLGLSSTAAFASQAPEPLEATRVLLVGDSFIARTFGQTLQSLLASEPDIEVARRGKSATGLARPDFFDWGAEARRLVDQHQPHLVVMVMGGNDGQDLLDEHRKGRVRWDTPAWPLAYRARLVSLMRSIEAPGRQVVWLELPRMESPRLERKVAFIRTIQREALDDLPQVTYLETHSLLRGEAGGWLRTVPSRPGRMSPLREPDGVHFTSAGGRYFAERLAPKLIALIRGDEGAGPEPASEAASR
jgi:uncharacterized protein